MRFLCSFLSLFLLSVSLPAQQERPRNKKPVLIRADRTEPRAEEAPPLPDPERAREHLEVGNFYFKRDNYRAAEERYREAVKYNPKWPEAYERLVRSLEKQKAFLEGVDVCDEFSRRNPASEEVERFRKWADKLRKEAAEAGASQAG